MSPHLSLLNLCPGIYIYTLPLQLVDADWIFHVDTDELLHPAGTPSYSLQELVIMQPPDIDTIVFPNYVRRY